MPRIKLRKRKGPLSAAQKLALKKAQEASARARRGTGKPDEPKRPRGKAKTDKAPSLRRSNKIHADDVKRRKSTSDERYAAAKADADKRHAAAKKKSDANSALLEKRIQESKSGGDRDVSKRSVSGLKKDRQTLHAKVKDGSASDEDKAHLKAVQLELKNRGLNRQKEKAGNERYAKEQERKAANREHTNKIARGEAEPRKLAPSAPSAPKTAEEMRREKRAKQEAAVPPSMRRGYLVTDAGYRNAVKEGLDAEDAYLRKKIADYERDKRSQRSTTANGQPIATGFPYANAIAQAKRRRSEIREEKEKARGLGRPEPGSDSGYRKTATPTGRSDDKAKAQIWRDNQQSQARDDIGEIRRIADKVISRDNVVKEIDEAYNPQRVVEAAKSALHYLDEARRYGLTAEEKKAYDRLSKIIERFKKRVY